MSVITKIESIFNGTAGINDTWQVSLGVNSFDISSITLVTKYVAGSVNGSITAKMAIGNTKFNISATYNGKSATIMGVTTSGSISLTSFGNELATMLGVLPSVTLPAINIVGLSFSFSTENITFNFTADTTVKSKLPFGTGVETTNASISLISTIDATTKKRTFSGNFTAAITLSGSVINVEFDFGTIRSVSGNWSSTDGKTLGFDNFADLLEIPHSINLPAGLDLSLTAISFNFDVTADQFKLAAISRNFGDSFFVAEKDSSGKMGFIFGVDFPSLSKLSGIPVIGRDLKAADFITISQAAIMISSSTFNNFKLPALPELAKAATPMVNGQTLQLSEGISFAADISLSTTGNTSMKNLKTLVGSDTIIVQVTYMPENFKIFIGLSNFSIPSPSGSKLKIPNAALTIVILPTVAFQLSGTLGLNVFGDKIDAKITLSVDEASAQVSFLITSRNPLPGPPGLKGIHFTQFGLIMGVYFEPPGLDFGIQGNFSIGEQTSDNNFAIILEIIEEIPNILYLSFYVDQLSLGKMVTLFTNSTPPSSISDLDIIKANDLSFYYCESLVTLPDSTIAKPGFGLSATLDILSFGAHGQFMINTGTGISGSGEMAPLNISHVLSISGHGKGITRKYLNGNLVTNNQVIPANGTITVKTLVAPGGPEFSFNTSGSPFATMDAAITLFDIVNESISASIAKSGISFTLNSKIASVESIHISCNLINPENFSGSGSFNFGIDQQIGSLSIGQVNIGTLTLKAMFMAAISIALTNQSFSMDLSGSFQFEGMNLILPKFNVSVAPATFADIAKSIVKKIETEITTIFSFLVTDAGKWASFVAAKVITAYGDAASVLKNGFKVSGEVAVAALHTIGMTADQAAAALKKVGYLANDISGGLKSVYNFSANQVAAALQTAGYTVSEIKDAIDRIFGHIHIDTSITPHLDVTPVPHGDTRLPHVDVTPVPHGDTTPHVDENATHVDRSVFGHHIDTGHVDQHGPHIDTPRVHTDVGPTHVDTPRVHTDVAAIHTDFVA